MFSGFMKAQLIGNHSLLILIKFKCNIIGLAALYSWFKPKCMAMANVPLDFYANASLGACKFVCH